MAANPAAARLTERYRLTQARLGARTVGQMRDAWQLLDLEDLDGSVDRWLAVTMPVVQAQRVASTTLARNYLQAFRVLELDADLTDFAVQTAGPVTPPLLATSLLVTGPNRVKSAMARGATLERASTIGRTSAAGAAMRHVLNGGRESILQTVETDSRALGWARATSGDPCGFCAMIASRGPAFSQESVDFQAHDHCTCTAEPVYRADAPWPAGADRYRALWEETTAGLSGQDAVNAFRAAVEQPAA